MSRLLNTLLDISKLESGAVKPEPMDFSISTLFEELGREFASVAAKKGIQLQVEMSRECVHSDPSLVEQILRNLVSNAVKYTREGTVRLLASRVRSIVRIEVSDTGVGIPADQLPLIYDEFYQVGISSNSSREGYGLGLSIVQRLVNLLGLELLVESEVGKGSMFTLTLPASRTGADVAHSEPQAPAKLNEQRGRCRVLLVEDDLAVRDATRLLLKVEGYHVTAVASLTEAMRAARAAEGVDLLVTDYHLQDGETGTQVIAAIREALQEPLKAVLLTGDTSNAIKELPRDPSLRIASKPIRAEELLTIIRGLLAA
jgi:two-component system CheB/CheR fusion protein